MRLLLTGASGYLGGRLLKNLNKENFDICPVSKNDKREMRSHDLTCAESVTSLIKDFDPDCIIHCAGHVPSDMKGYMDRKKNTLNEIMTKNLLNLTTCPMIYVSSMTVYGNSDHNSVQENQECFPETAYAYSKLNGESLIKKDGRGGFAVRIPGLFGLPRRSGLVHNLLMSAKHNKTFSLPQRPIFWSGMHVEHAAEAILMLLPKINDNFSPVNIGYRGKSSVNTLLETINELYGTDLKQDIEHPNFEFDLTLFKHLTSAAISTLREGIERVGAEID